MTHCRRRFVDCARGGKADAVGYALNHKSELATYLTHPEADIDNNRAERAIRPFTIARKNFLFCDTERGAEASARVFTIIECAKPNDLDVFEVLEEADDEVAADEAGCTCDEDSLALE